MQLCSHLTLVVRKCAPHLFAQMEHELAVLLLRHQSPKDQAPSWLRASARSRSRDSVLREKTQMPCGILWVWGSVHQVR